MKFQSLHSLFQSQMYMKDAYSKEEAFHMIVNGECGVFSPKLLETFRSVKKQFEELSEEKEQI